MPLNNTIILPADDANQAKTDFDNALHLDKVTIIVFGDTPKASQAANNADAMANGTHAGFERQVIWVKNNAQWNTLKSSIGDGSISAGSVQPAQAICLSITLSRKAEFITDISKTPDNIIMTLAFVQASKA